MMTTKQSEAETYEDYDNVFHSQRDAKSVKIRNRGFCSKRERKSSQKTRKLNPLYDCSKYSSSFSSSSQSKSNLSFIEAEKENPEPQMVQIIPRNLSKIAPPNPLLKYHLPNESTRHEFEDLHPINLIQIPPIQKEKTEDTADVQANQEKEPESDKIGYKAIMKFYYIEYSRKIVPNPVVYSRFGKQCYEHSHHDSSENVPKGSANQDVNWYYFKVNNTFKNRKVKFNILNLSKPTSLYNKGMKVLIYSRNKANESDVGWYRGGSHISYYKNQYRKEGSRPGA